MNCYKKFLLKINGYLYKTRIIVRFLKRKLGLEKGKKETFKSVCNLIKWTDTFQEKNMPEIRQMLEQYQHKVVWISNKRDIEKLIKE